MRLSRFKQTKSVELIVEMNSLEEYRVSGNKSSRLCRDKRSFLDSEGYWNVYPIGFNSTQVFVACPHCGEIHLHGRGREPEYQYQGHRASQCLNRNSNGYIIKRGNHA